MLPEENQVATYEPLKRCWQNSWLIMRITMVQSMKRVWRADQYLWWMVCFTFSLILKFTISYIKSKKAGEFWFIISCKTSWWKRDSECTSLTDTYNHIYPTTFFKFAQTKLIERRTITVYVPIWALLTQIRPILDLFGFFTSCPWEICHSCIGWI
jgi:hypothetical protein